MQSRLVASLDFPEGGSRQHFDDTGGDAHLGLRAAGRCDLPQITNHVFLARGDAIWRSSRGRFCHPEAIAQFPGLLWRDRSSKRLYEEQEAVFDRFSLIDQGVPIAEREPGSGYRPPEAWFALRARGAGQFSAKCLFADGEERVLQTVVSNLRACGPAQVKAHAAGEWFS